MRTPLIDCVARLGSTSPSFLYHRMRWRVIVKYVKRKPVTRPYFRVICSNELITVVAKSARLPRRTPTVLGLVSRLRRRVRQHLRTLSAQGSRKFVFSRTRQEPTTASSTKLVYQVTINVRPTPHLFLRNQA